MTPLTQQLKDKKKGCGKKFNLNPFGYVCGTLLKQWTPDNTGKEEVDLCPTCQAEIAILEQAIAEMQKQRQEILDKIRKFQKELLEIIDDCVNDWSYIERKYNEKFDGVKK